MLRDFVQQCLDVRWSPEQVSHALGVQFADRPARQLCTESLYQALYSRNPWVQRTFPSRLKVVANTASAHNVIVCTLCSWYPIALLGPSPSWYKSEGYRSRVVRDPRDVLHEFGYDVPADVEITVWDASAESRHMVLPRRPVGTVGLSERELAGLVTRSGLIGVAAV